MEDLAESNSVPPQKQSCLDLSHTLFEIDCLIKIDGYMPIRKSDFTLDWKLLIIEYLGLCNGKIGRKVISAKNCKSPTHIWTGLNCDGNKV